MINLSKMINTWLASNVIVFLIFFVLIFFLFRSFFNSLCSSLQHAKLLLLLSNTPSRPPWCVHVLIREANLSLFRTSPRSIPVLINPVWTMKKLCESCAVQPGLKLITRVPVEPRWCDPVCRKATPFLSGTLPFCYLGNIFVWNCTANKYAHADVPRQLVTRFGELQRVK